MGIFGAGERPCPAGSICSGEARTFVGRKTNRVGGTRTAILDLSLIHISEPTRPERIWYALVCV